MSIDVIEIEDAIEIEDVPEVFPLAALEQQKLEHCEAVIARGLHTYIEVGNALLEIRDQRLYRATHQTYADYCNERWGMSRQRAYQLIDASQVATSLSTIVDTSAIPESHMREIAKASPADRPRVIERAREQTNGKPTAKAIQQAAAEISAPDLPPEFAIVQRRFANYGHLLTEQIQGQHRVYSIKREGMAGRAMFDWAMVLDCLERMDENPPPPPPTSVSARSYDDKEAADLVLITTAENAITHGDTDRARALLAQVQVATWRRDRVLATIAEPTTDPQAAARAFYAEQCDRLTRFGPSGMVSQVTFRQALDHIKALLEVAV